jgi:hypothetical protein
MSKSSSAAASQISKDATGVRKRTASELAEELQIHAQVRSMHDRRAVPARKSMHARNPCMIDPCIPELGARPNFAPARTPCATELRAPPHSRAQPWKSGPSGQRKASEINLGFSPCCGRCSRRPRFSLALSPVPLQATENAGFNPEGTPPIRDANQMRTTSPGVQFLESPILQFATEKRFARGKH